MRTSLLRKIRLLSGLVIFAYVASHLLNLALGLWSLQIMDAARPVFMAAWQNPLGLFVLYGSMATHMALGFHALFMRRTLRLNGFELVQLLMGLALPPLMVLHVLGTRVVSLMVDFEPSYAWIMLLYWKWLPIAGLRQVCVLMVAWVHGCMGLYYWVRLQAWWPKWRGLLYPLALLVPVSGLLGMVEAGKDALLLAESKSWMARISAQGAAIDNATLETIYQIQNQFLVGYFCILLLVLIGRYFYHRRQLHADEIQVTYRQAGSVRHAGGISLLEISRAMDVTHTSLCGGKGRCGTCRVRIIDGMEFLPPASPLERETLTRIGADADVRLACQSVPFGSPLTLERLVAVDSGIEVLERPRFSSGSKLRVAILDLKLLGLSSLVESRQAPDALFLVNRYLAGIRPQIEAAGGAIDRLDAGGVRALFGLQGLPEQAVHAALSVAKELIAVPAHTGEQGQVDMLEFTGGFNIAICLHVGEVLVGELQLGDAQQLTAFGEPINDVTDLHRLALSERNSLVLTDDFALACGLDVSALEAHEYRSEPREDGAYRARIVQQLDELAYA